MRINKKTFYVEMKREF